MEEKTQEELNKEERKQKLKIWVQRGVIIALVIIIILLLLRRCSYNTKPVIENPVPIENSQDVYVTPEQKVDRSKSVVMPGWGAFNIPANTANITKGIMFNNPSENVWYEIVISYEGENLEKMVVNSGTKVEIDHILKLANPRVDAVDLKEYDDKVFLAEANKDGKLTIEAINIFDGTQSFTIVGSDNKEYEFNITCGYNCYYMTFSLYLGTPEDKDNAKLLYSSGLVEPGNQITSLELSEPLAKGSYDAFVFIQPYKIDRTTKTNSGSVVIKLNVK